MNHFTVYKITNLVNGKVYIGKHQTKYLDDNYMGSGKLIKAAIKKYGLENFKKEILHVFETEDEMNKKEAELVTEEFIASGISYNLCSGGNGGFGYINTNGLAFGKNVKESNSKGGIRGIRVLHEMYKTNPSIGLKISASNKRRYARGEIKTPSTLGLRFSEETKMKMSKSGTGPKNSQFGTMWITNGTENKKIKKDLDKIPEGWYKGRK